MNFSERKTFALALSETFSADELHEMRKKALTSGLNGKITSWSDIGLSNSISYDFNIGTAVDILSAAIKYKSGMPAPQRQTIKKFVL